MFLAGCLSPSEAYSRVEWSVVLVVGAMLALGLAMEETGAAAFLADGLLKLLGSPGPVVLLTAVFLLVVALTQPMSNQAAAAVVVPVAVQVAELAGMDPRPFCVMIAVAASISYLTPLEPACLMVYGPGRYRFMDFVRVGAPLTVVLYLLSIYLVPRLWPPQ